MKVKKQIMLNLEENGLLIQMTQKEKDTYLDTKNLVIEYENIYSAKDIDFEELLSDCYIKENIYALSKKK